MNAARQKLNQYDRAKAPLNLSPLRYGDVQNIEVLNEHRSQKLREAAEIRRLEDEKKRISELEHYYNLKPAKKVKKETDINPETGRRKLSSAYILNPSSAPVKKNVKDTGNYQNVQKRLIFSETNAAQGLSNQNSWVARTKSLSTTILTILMVFVMLSCVLIKQAEISNQTYLNSQMEKEISTLNIELSKLNMEKALKEDLTGVQYSAGSKGMSRPLDSQVVFVSVNPMPNDNYQNASADLGASNADDTSGTDNMPAESNKNIVNKFTDYLKQSGETVKGWLN